MPRPVITYDHRISDVQCRMARAALEISRDKLAELSQVARATIYGLEKGGYATKPDNAERLRVCLERLGIEFLWPDGVRVIGRTLRERVS